MKRTIHRAGRLEGILKVPGDKSISHRALILGAAARGRQVVDGLSTAADVRTTADALRAMNCFVENLPDGRTMVLAHSLHDTFDIDAGNSGTSARLLAGFAAGRAVRCTLDGDASLRGRPMRRVAEPLTQMGARITLSEQGTLPAVIEGGALHGIRYDLPVPSAQVKSALLIAGLFADGDTTVVEPVPTRDHTEIMLASMGADITRADGAITVRGGTPLEGIHVTVPGDLSSAAFFIVAALIVPGSRVHLPFTGINPRRTGILTVLRSMGGSVEVEADHAGAEAAGDLTVRTSALHGVTIDDPGTVASIIDEIPILAVAATQAEGVTTIRGAGELRHKESDRIESIVTDLRAMGARIEAIEDGFTVEGPTPLRGAAVASFGDHRIAMAMTVAGLVADGTTLIDDADAVAISYPGFYTDLRSLTR
ncbi:MAG TPA: 3-phosphoshikimate 1-carboxyvinyltransferase [Candidatus Krumholzibacteria bacterium]|nr:3-phosphoshikimate 1-carboxyvinyltransferase [Candidatus Krumholzibacteria bacterium]